METDSGTRLGDIKIDGGVSRSRLFCQILADITGKKIIRSMLEETTSLGIFLGIGLAEGIWKNKKDINIEDKSEVFEPRISKGTRDIIYKNWKRAVGRSREWNRPE